VILLRLFVPFIESFCLDDFWPLVVKKMLSLARGELEEVDDKCVVKALLLRIKG
jgi:hypothetical protein